MSKLILPNSVDWALQGQRTSSAAPSLSPEKRYVQDRTEFSQFKTETVLKEGFDEQRQSFMDGEIAMNVMEAQVGKAMKSDEVEKRLGKLNANLIFEVSKADSGKVGVYLLDRMLPEGRRFLVGMERGWCPEWTQTKYEMEKRMTVSNPIPKYEWFKKYVSEKRGWRKVLASLIRSKVVTRAGCDRLFGIARNSKRWKEYLEGY